MEEARMNTTTIEAPELDDRIAAAFRDGATSDQIASLIIEVGEAAAAASDEADRARTPAPTPAVSSAKVATARRAMGDAAFRQERMHTALMRLQDRLGELQAQEEDHRRWPAYERSRAERDKLAAELKASYPAIAAQ